MIAGGYALLPVRDVRRSVRFYVETLGFKVLEERTDGARLDAGHGFEIALSKAPANESARGPSNVPLVFTVNRPLEEVVLVLENRGVAFSQPPHEAERARIACFADPDGHSFTLSEPRSDNAGIAARSRSPGAF